MLLFPIHFGSVPGDAADGNLVNSTVRLQSLFHSQ